MMHIVDYNGDDDAYYVMRLQDQAARNEERFGACEDDCEVTAPYIGILPEESGKEHGSPLNFKAEELISIESSCEIDHLIQAAFKQGV